MGSSRMTETAFAATLVAVFAQIIFFTPARSGGTASLQLEAKIPLGKVAGRIDHMAIDLAHRRLFVAELGNGSVSVVDLDTQKVFRRIPGFKEPQGLGYVSQTNTLYVASAGDGSVQMLSGPDLKSGGRIDAGEDADNVRVDSSNTNVLVGYGRGGLAVIDVAGRRVTADIGLEGHPEGFQLESNGSRVFVNVPNARSIAVVDRTTRKTLAKWPTEGLRDNFPMALEESRKQVMAVFRSPPRLAAFSMDNGRVVASTATCADSDDLFVDTKRRRIYVSCGEGFIDVFAEGAGFQSIGRVATVPGARTSLFVPALDRFFLAVHARPGQPAAIWVYRPLA